jgi:NADPH:quinone reductase
MAAHRRWARAWSRWRREHSLSGSSSRLARWPRSHHRSIWLRRPRFRWPGLPPCALCRRPALGKRVLVTGASGRLGVQLAARAGAHVIALVGSVARAEGLAERGAHEVVHGLEGLDQPVDVVLDNVGGAQMVAAWQLLAPGGNLQSIGWSSGEPAVFPPYSTVGPPKSLSSFLNEGEAGVVAIAAGAARGLLVSRGRRRPRKRRPDA